MVNTKTVLSVFLVLLVFSACKKYNDNIFLSNEGTQGFDGYTFSDSLQISSRTVREDSLKTDSLSHNLLGVINDPVFGVYKASTFCEFKLPQIDKVISTETLDSVVLMLQYTSNIAYYGDLNSPLSFKVYELNQNMGSSVTHSNQTLSYDPTPIGAFNGSVKLSDSIYITELGKRGKSAPGITIKLSTAAAQKLFNASLNDLHSNDNFIQYFKGIALVPDQTPAIGAGIIPAINLRGSLSKIRIYYNDSLQSDFKVIDNAKRFSAYQTSNLNASIAMQKSASSSSDFDTSYVQAMTGAKTHIQFPNLFSIIKNTSKKIAIGKAELIIRPLAGTYASPFSLPSRLLIVQPDLDNGLNAPILDNFEAFYGGKYDAVKNEYKFYITRHMQSLFTDYQVNGKNTNKGLYLIVPSDLPIAPSRMVIDSRKRVVDQGIQLKLIYTEL